MPQSFAVLIDDVESKLQDSSNTLFTVAELTLLMEDAIREISDYDENVLLQTFRLETRTGQATATTAGSLVDTDETQFAATDVGKVIHDTTDDTYAIVTAFTSTSVLVLSKDIMVSGDDYEMFNQNCYNIRQLFMGDEEDFVGADRGVRRIEFHWPRKQPRPRKFRDRGRGVIEIDFAFPIDDASAADADLNVGVWIARRHQVSQLTDLAGALTAGGSEGDTSIAVDGLTGTEVVVEDQELTIAGVRGVYRVTADVTLSSGAGTLAIQPPLENDTANNDVVTFTGSTLNRRLERLLIDLTAARASISKATRFLRYADSAATEIALGNAEVDQAVTDLATALPLINTVTVGGPNVPGQYGAQVAGDIAAAGGFTNLTAQKYMDLAAIVAKEFTIWGERLAKEVIKKLELRLPPRTKSTYSTAV